MAIQSGSTIYARDVDSYISVTKHDTIYATDINSYVSVTRGKPIYAREMNKAIEILSSNPIGGKIFYDAGDNGAIYIFFDSNHNVISDTSISGLQNAVFYLRKGTPTKDRFYVAYPELLNSGNYMYWGFRHNADIKESGGNIVNTGTAIGTGKIATQAILNYIDTYASSEKYLSTNVPSSDISQSSHDGYNLYRNCGGGPQGYLWDAIRDVNNNSLGGCNDWFIPSRDEMYQIVTSSVIPDTIKINYPCSSSAHSNSYQAWSYASTVGRFAVVGRGDTGRCHICRAF